MASALEDARSEPRAESQEAWSGGQYLRPSSRGEARVTGSASQLRQPPGAAHAWPQPQPLCAQPRHAIFPTSAPPWPDLTNPDHGTTSGAKKKKHNTTQNHRVPRNSLERPRAGEPRPYQPEGLGTSSQAEFSPDR